MNLKLKRIIVSSFTLLTSFYVSNGDNNNLTLEEKLAIIGDGPKVLYTCENECTITCTEDGPCGTKIEIFSGTFPKGTEIKNPSCSPGSIIDNNGLEYYASSVDFMISNTPSACSTCSGSVQTGNTLPSLGVTRELRPRYSLFNAGDLQASFGYGYYWKEIDKTLHINKTNVIYVHDIRQSNKDVRAMFNGTLGTWTAHKHSYFQSITLFDENDLAITDSTNTKQARSAIKLNHDGTTEHYEIFWLQGSAKTGRTRANAVGRLVALMDRNGNTIQISYQTPVREDGFITGSSRQERSQWRSVYPEMWKKDTVTDAYGRQIKCHYEMQDGRYVINKLELPNNEEITYEYDAWGQNNGFLTAVNLPDGSRSTWSAQNVGFGLSGIIQLDFSASAQEQLKFIYLTIFMKIKMVNLVFKYRDLSVVLIMDLLKPNMQTMW